MPLKFESPLEVNPNRPIYPIQGKESRGGGLSGEAQRDRDTAPLILVWMMNAMTAIDETQRSGRTRYEITVVFQSMSRSPWNFGRST